MNIFKTWTFGGVRYIAVRTGEGEQVVDESGRYFGSWQDHNSFRKEQRKGRTDELSLGGGARLAARGPYN